jgi:hypothetical protein
MPLVKSRPGCFKCLSWVILVENLDDSVPAHIKGREGNHLVGTQIRSLRVRVCEEQEGSVNIYSVLYYVLQGSRVSPPWFLIP